MAEISKLLNLLNEYSPIYSFSVCQCCNTIAMRSVLLISGEILPKGKFKRLIHEMLEDTYFWYPLITEVVANGYHKDLFDRYMADHKYDMTMGSKITPEAGRNILDDMKSVITGLKMPINEDACPVDGFVMDCKLRDANFPFRVGITLDYENAVIRLLMAPQFTVADVKVPVMTELINRLNRGSISDHLYIHRESKRVVLLKGIMIDSSVLDKMELETSIRTFLGNGSIFFPIINEQLSSNETPEVLLEKIRKQYDDSH